MFGRSVVRLFGLGGQRSPWQLFGRSVVRVFCDCSPFFVIAVADVAGVDAVVAWCSSWRS